MKRILGTIGLLMALAMPASGEQSFLFLVQADLVDACTLTIAEDQVMDFGVLAQTQASPVKYVKIEGYCTLDTDYRVFVEGGPEDRTMRGMTIPPLRYSLYKDAACTKPFELEGTGIGGDYSTVFNIYGKIDQASILSAHPGQYLDTVYVTIEVL